MDERKDAMGGGCLLMGFGALLFFFGLGSLSKATSSPETNAWAFWLLAVLLLPLGVGVIYGGWRVFRSAKKLSLSEASNETPRPAITTTTGRDRLKALVGDPATVHGYARVYEELGPSAGEFETQFLDAVEALVAEPYSGWISSGEELWTKDSILGVGRCLQLLSGKEYRGRTMSQVFLGFSNSDGVQLEWGYSFSDDSRADVTMRIRRASSVEIDGQLKATDERCYLMTNSFGFTWDAKALTEDLELTR